MSCTCVEAKICDDVWRFVEVFVAEYIGTMMTMLFGCAGTIQGLIDPPQPYLLPGITFGLIFIPMVQAFADISGSHFNPAVSLAWFILGRLCTFGLLLLFLIAQLLGALTGLYIIKVLTPVEQECICCANPHEGVSSLAAVFIEFFGTAVLILVACSIADPRNKCRRDCSSIIYGLTMLCLVVAGDQYSGASFNPARSLAAAIVNNEWKNIWIYTAGPMAAAILIPIIYITFFCKFSERILADHCI